MGIKVHGFPLSPPVRRVVATLEEKGLPYDFQVVEIMAGHQKKEPFISLNPFGKIPAIEDGDLKLFESRAITQYIARAYPDMGTPLVPSDPRKGALVIMWAEVEAQQFDPTASKLSYELVIKPLLKRETDEEQVAELQEKLSLVLDVYEARLAESRFLGGEDFSLADQNHLPILHNLLGKALFEARTNVKRWADEILARPAWQKSVEKMKL